MMKAVNILEYIIIATGLAVSLTQVQEVLCVVLLIVDSCWLFLKVLFKIVKALKDGELTQEEIEDIEEDFRKHER